VIANDADIRSAPTGSGWTVRSGLLIGLIFLTYVLIPSRDYYWDGIAFAQVIEDAASFNVSLFHPNHLAYNTVGYLVYRAAHWAGLRLRALQVLQLCNAIFGALAAALLFRIIAWCKITPH
jgi:hypothetical protein